VQRDGARVQLTPIEFRILHVLAQNAGHVIPHSRILEYAWEFEVDEPGLLRSHLYHLRTKLKLPRRGPGAIRSVSGVGYSLNPVT
jgi:DNA-binding response OmpR family regulator